MLKVFMFEFESYYGGSAVVVAEDRESALALLLKDSGGASLYETQLRDGTATEVSLETPAVLAWDAGELA